MAGSFKFKQFSVHNEASALKVGTDAVLLGAAMTIRPEWRRALDVGTGTGVIALMAAQRSPELHICGIDIDGASAGEAALNFSESPWSGRLEALCCPLQGFNPDGGPFDLIFSNPPFFDDSLRNPDPREAAARHTSSLDLKDIFSFTRGHLSAGGSLSLIIPADALLRSRRLAVSFGLYPYRCVSIRTVECKPVKRCIVEYSRLQSAEVQEFVTLMKDGERSPEYSAMTRDFYL